MSLTITSPAFLSGGVIPVRFTRDGENLSPPLEWKGVPPGSRSLILTVDDPDAPSGTFHHWAFFDIAPLETGLSESASRIKPGVGRQGVNDFGHACYDGPQPPRGHGPHHYHFRLAALAVPRLDVARSARVEEVWTAARRHILAEADLVGTSER